MRECQETDLPKELVGVCRTYGINQPSVALGSSENRVYKISP